MRDMNTNDRRPTRRDSPVDPSRYVSRRLDSSLALVAGAIAGLLSAGIIELAGLPSSIAVGAGLVAFVITAALVIDLAVGGRMPWGVRRPK